MLIRLVIVGTVQVFIGHIKPIVGIPRKPDWSFILHKPGLTVQLRQNILVLKE
eukprot:12982.XXX_398666_398824_1 [CDS] Oithona nana genome sequencing.